jgi:MoxR-vWA-beta-propeller ternary system domain bpX2
MSHPLQACRAARIPASGLALLAPLRATAGILVIPGEPAWLTWEGQRPDVIAAVLAIPGAELFEPRDGRWFRPGERLPVSELPPPGDAVPIDRAIIPAMVAHVEPPPRAIRRVPSQLVRSDAPRPTTALRCSLAALQTWADVALSADIVHIKAARNGDVCWLLGSKLPSLAGAERFWGDRVLVPLGYRAEPDWSEAALREAANVGPDELLILTLDANEAIPSDAFRPLSRAAIRRKRPDPPA